MSGKSTSGPNGPGSSVEDSPARASASLERGWASQIRALVSGRSTRESLAHFDHAASSWRTSQLSLLEDSTASSVTWPRSGMMLSGTVYRLQPLAPLTAVTGSSWSRGEYPTPSATEYGSSQNEGQVSHKRPTAGTPSLFSWARAWPTPLSRDARGPTKGRNAQGGEPLSSVARTWPTPKARLGDPKRGFPSASMAQIRLGAGRRNLEDAVSAMWPTATAGDANSSGARGYGPISKSTGRPRSEGGTTLTDATCRSGRPLPTTCTHGGECKLTLNPRFVEWLMGFPIGHTDSEPSETP